MQPSGPKVLNGLTLDVSAMRRLERFLRAVDEKRGAVTLADCPVPDGDPQYDVLAPVEAETSSPA